MTVEVTEAVLLVLWILFMLFKGAKAEVREGHSSNTDPVAVAAFKACIPENLMFFSLTE